MDTDSANALDHATANAAAVAAVEGMLASTEASAAPAAVVAPTVAPTSGTALPAQAAPAITTPVLSPEVAADLSSRMAAVARAEAESVRQRAEHRAESEATKAELARIAAEHAELERALAENPLKVLEARKWTLESLVQSAATQATPEAVRTSRVEAELERVKAEIAKRDADAQAASAEAARNQAAATLKTQLIPTQLATVKDEIPYLRAWFNEGALVDAVYGIMGQKFRETNGTETVEPVEAARQLEKALRERVQRLPGASVTPPTPSVIPSTVVRPSATITNQHTQAGPNTSAINPFDRAALDARAMAELAAAMKA